MPNIYEENRLEYNYQLSIFDNSYLKIINFFNIFNIDISYLGKTKLSMGERKHLFYIDFKKLFENTILEKEVVGHIILLYNSDCSKPISYYAPGSKQDFNTFLKSK